MEEIRLQKYLAVSGVASRRKAEEFILSGRVKVNGAVVTEMGIKVSSDDIIEVDGVTIWPEERKVYILLNKPTGYVTTVKDQFGRPSVLDLLKEVNERVYPVGRLDYDTSGMLILTNDGDFAFKMTHPKHSIDKKYFVLVKGIPSEESIGKLICGVMIDGKVTSPAKARLLKKENNNAYLEIIIHEGRNRQVRKMCECIGHPVISLTRIAIGNLQIEGLPEGKWRYLEEKEINKLLMG